MSYTPQNPLSLSLPSSLLALPTLLGPAERYMSDTGRACGLACSSRRRGGCARCVGHAPCPRQGASCGSLSPSLLTLLTLLTFFPTQVCALGLHPLRLILAAGASDSVISIYSL